MSSARSPPPTACRSPRRVTQLTFAAPENRRHHSRTAVTMNDGNHPQRPLLRRVSTQVVTHADKSVWPFREVRAAVALLREARQIGESLLYVGNHPVGSVAIFAGDLVPNRV